MGGGREAEGEAGALWAWLRGPQAVVLEPGGSHMYSWRPVSPHGRDSVLTSNQQQLTHQFTWNEVGGFVYWKFSVDFSLREREIKTRQTKQQPKKQSERSSLGSLCLCKDQRRPWKVGPMAVLSGWDSGWVGPEPWDSMAGGVPGGEDSTGHVEDVKP